MAIVLLTGNLNVFGNAGQYETDPSTWGFSLVGITSSRSSEQAYAGLHSQKLVPVSSVFGLGSMILSHAKYVGTTGKKYLARVRVKTTTGAPIASDNCIFTFENGIVPFLDSETTFTVNEAKDNWVEVEARWTHGIIPAGGIIYLSLFQIDIANELNPAGAVYVDDLRIYEYEDTEEEEPEPEPVETENVWFSRNPVTHPMAAPDAGWASILNYRLYNDVRVEEAADSGVYTSRLKINLYPFSDGNVTFQVREAFRKVLTAVPPIGQTEIIRLTDRIKRFKHNTGKLFAIATEPDVLTASAVQLVLLGGLSKFKAPAIPDFFGTYLTTHKKFMSWAPTTKPVDGQQEDYLNFFVYGNTITQLNLVLKCYYDDGTNTTNTIKTTTCSYRNLYQIPAGPANTGALLIDPTKTLVKYELWLTDQAANVITEVRTYVLDVFTHPRKRLFMFLNSLGGYEILRFTAQGEQSVDISKEEIVKFLPITYGQYDGERAATNATARRSTNTGTGYFTELSKQWLDYMEDFLLSKKVFEVRGSVLVPVVIAGGSFALNSDQVYERFIRFNAVNAYEEENHTPFDA